jgi:quinohemoprotein ethanol dehydrogenase
MSGNIAIAHAAIVLVSWLSWANPATAAASSESSASPNKNPLAGWVDKARLLATDVEPQQWLTSGRDFKQQQYSPLTQINTGSVHQLGFAWEYSLTYRGRVRHKLEATPQVVDGVMYTSGPWGTVYAVDARTGDEIWRYDPDVDGSWVRHTCCGVVNRGVALWQGRVYVGTLDGYLVALDAATGREQWKVDTFTNRDAFYSITGAPWIAGDKVVIGNSGAEMGVRGYISAYDAKSGKFAWRFYTVPGKPGAGFEHPEMAMAIKTWSPDSSWEAGGGGTVWGHMAYDPELNLLYVGTGNGSPWPVWQRSPGGGDNLYLSSILAINPDTGRLVWHYQTTPGDSWDYTATQHMILAELDIQGKKRRVLMQAPKNGFFYVIDRATGELLSAKNYAPINWASRVDLNTGKPLLTGQSKYQHEPKVIYPAPGGAHNWQPMSFSPATGLVYVPVRNSRALFVNRPDLGHNRKGWNNGADELYPPLPTRHAKYQKEFGDAGAMQLTLQGRLIAWDPVAEREVWHTPLGFHGNCGTLSTAGNLVFQGTVDGHFIVYDARTGKKLKDIEVGTGIMAAPMSFAVGGEQYVAVMAGAFRYQNAGRILAFKLGGGNVPLPKPIVAAPVPEPPPIRRTVEQRRHGEELFQAYCVTCHWIMPSGKSPPGYGPIYPDLSSMSETTHQVFRKIVLEGIFTAGGMASFADTLNDTDQEDIHAYLIAEQHKRKTAESAAAP